MVDGTSTSELMCGGPLKNGDCIQITSGAGSYDATVAWPVGRLIAGILAQKKEKWL